MEEAQAAAAPEMTKAPRALFVLGVPRSGTTVVASYLATPRRVLDMIEYAGFYVANGIAPPIMATYPGPLKFLYTQDLATHAKEFAEDAAIVAGCDWYCDGTPWNLRCAGRLRDQLQDAIFVLMLRHYSGTIQSLRRLYGPRFPWAGRTLAQSARLWAIMNSEIDQLPWDRTVVVGYDALAADPEPTLHKLRADLERLGFDTSDLDLRAFALSQANPKERRPTLASMEADGTVRLQRMTTVDAAAWTDEIDAAVRPIVAAVHQHLLERFPGVYLENPIAEAAPSGAQRRSRRRSPKAATAVS
jgi:Sulfotransferase family